MDFAERTFGDQPVGEDGKAGGAKPKRRLRSVKDRVGGGWDFAADENPIGRKLSERIDGMIALALAAFFAVLHGATSFFWVFPGNSARYVATIFGIEPPPIPSEQIFVGLFRVLSGVAGESCRTSAAAAWTLFFSCAGLFFQYLLVVAIFRLMLDLVHLRAGVTDGERWGWRVPRIAGVLSVLGLGLGAPYWTASTRVNADSFHFAMLVLASYLQVRNFASDRLAPLCFSAVLYGALCTQSGAAVQALPVFAVVAFVSAIRSERTLWLSLGLPLFLFGLSAGATVALCTVSFMHGESFRLLGWSGPGSVSAALLLANALSALAAFVQPHWIVLGALAFLPFLSFLAVGRWSLDGMSHFALRFLEFAIFAASAVVLSCSKYSPWGLLGFRSELVFSHAMASVCFAYCVLCVHQRALFAFARKGPHSFPGARALGLALRCALFAATAVFFAFEARIGRAAADTRTAHFLLTYVDAVVDGLGGRGLLVTDFILEDIVRIRARERGVDIAVVNVADPPLSVGRRLLREKIADPALRNAFDLGILPFFREYVGRDPEAGSRVALTYFPDLWNFGPYRAYPRGLCFVGAPADAPLSDPLGEGGEDPVGANVEAWRAVARRLQSELAAVPEDASPALLAAARIVRQRVSFVGNDLAYWLHVSGRPADALALWRSVHAFAPSNLSAALNLRDALGRAGLAAERERAERDLATLRHRLEGPLDVWEISRSQGRIASPDAFASLGISWAEAEQPGLAIGVLESAVRDGLLARDAAGGVSPLLLALGAVTGGVGDAAASERAFSEALKGDPDSVVALEGLLGARLSLGDLEGAAPLFDRLARAGVPDSRLVRARMSFHVQSKDFDAAEKVVADALAAAPRDPDLLLDLFSLLSLRFASAEEPDRAALRRRMEEIVSLLRLDPSVRAFQGAVAGAMLHLFDGQFAEARDEFRIADAARPGLPGVVNQILRLDYALQDRPRAEVHARRLLELTPDHGFANYIMGSLALGAGRIASAKAFLERSAAHWDSPLPRGDLAWALYLEGDFSGSERLAREALALDPGQHEILDTLGLALLAQSRFSEARETLGKAAERASESVKKGLSPPGSDRPIRLHFARALLDSGFPGEAREALALLDASGPSFTGRDAAFRAELRAALSSASD